jgi:hypothetical protein
MRRLFRVLGLTLALTGAGRQEPATITGRVTNAQGQPSAATVTLVGTTFTTTTDAEGRYRLTEVPPRHYTLSVQSRGGAYATRHVRLTAGANATVNVVVGVQARGDPPRQP